jgi:RNA polymerase sigma-70 factor (ECF subfamily)
MPESGAHAPETEPPEPVPPDATGPEAAPTETALPAPTSTGNAPPWLEPYPDVLLDRAAAEPPGPEPRYDGSEAISLDFITALQLLPPRQRAALVLRDVLGYQAAEVAQMLDITQEAVDTSVERARITVDSHLADSTSIGRPAPRPDSSTEHRLVARFTAALERADLDALLELFVADVRLSMPPAMLEYRGIESAQRVLSSVTFRSGRTYRVVPTRANGQPAFGMYLADPHASVYRAYCLLVITIAGDRISAVTAFSTTIMTRFGLPRSLPENY